MGFSIAAFLPHPQAAHPSPTSGRQGSVIQDRSVYEDAEIFAKNLFLQGDISERDFGVYQDLYQILVTLLPPPDMIIYLKTSVPVLAERIARRGRDFEADIPQDYLNRLNGLYESWIANVNQCPVLIISTDNLDLVTRREHIDLVVNTVKRKNNRSDRIAYLGKSLFS